MKLRDIKKSMSALANTKNVSEGAEYWFYKLLNYCLGIFEYKGLPESLPAREIEANLLLTGHAVFFTAGRDGLVCVPTSIYGYDKYYAPTKAVYGNVALISKKLTFGVNAEVVYNNYIRGNVLLQQEVDGGLLTYIKRYSRMLADIESTFSIRLVNTRATEYQVANTQQMAEQIKAYNAQLEAGEDHILIDNNFVNTFRTVERPNYPGLENVNDLLIARDKILSMFFRDIGVKMEQNVKRAQLTTEEVTADDQLLIINIKDMLKERREGLERVNRHFGLNITVDISEEFTRKGVNENGSTDNTDII